MTRRLSLIEAFAFRIVPKHWREPLRSDLEEQLSGSRSTVMAAHAARVGVRLHLARMRDWLVGGSPSPARDPRQRSFMRDFSRDLRFAVRGAVRRPGHALAIIATLAVGIGANTAIFSVFNWILFRPLPGVARPAELVTIKFKTPKFAGMFYVSYSDYVDLRDGVGGFSTLAASAPMQFDFATAGRETDRIEAEIVTSNYFDVMEVRTSPGRAFIASDEGPGDGTPVAVISRHLWRRAFNDDPNIVGRAITLNGRPFTVAGVTPRGFQGRSIVTATEIWVAIGAYQSLLPNMGQVLTNRRSTLFGDFIGRLKPGVTMEVAQQQANAVAAAARELANRTPGGRRSTIGPVLEAGAGQESFAADRLLPIFRLLMGAVGLVLLLACANAANLLLARASGRRREIAVCQAIGASRFRIVRQQLAEGLVLSLAAGAAGLLLAIWLASLFNGMRVISFMPELKGVGLDWRVGAFTLLAAIATGLVFAILPAITSSRVDLQSSLKDGITSSRRGRPVVRGALVAVQITVSVLLLVGAGLFLRTLNNIRALDLGMRTDGVVSFGMHPSRYGYSDERAHQYARDLVERMRRTAGVRDVAYTWTTPFLPMRSDMSFERLDARGREYSAANTAVSPGYFRTMSIPLVAGRDFSDAEFQYRKKDGPSVVIISSRMAKEAFPDGRAVGSQIVLHYPKGQVAEIVGVAGDVRGRPLTNDPEPWTYTPAQNITWGTIQVRSSLPLAETAAQIRAASREIDPVVSPYDIEPFTASVDRALTEQRLFARLSGIFAGVAALLAAIGIYAMMSGAVSERRREFGIRLALGARAVSVLQLVMRTSVLLAVVSVVLGLAAASLLTRLIAARLYGVTPFDPITLAVAAVAIVALSAIASLVPALRAARIDPVRSLRAE